MEAEAVLFELGLDVEGVVDAQTAKGPVIRQPLHEAPVLRIDSDAEDVQFPYLPGGRQLDADRQLYAGSDPGRHPIISGFDE
ncbi:MAG: hypothetical protein V1875_03965 [Candidatus Altiarchaeota archaeon]